MKQFTLLLLGGFAIFMFSCKPDPGPGGKAEIKFEVKHHDEEIPQSIVYIKYDATESPGTDASAYDASVTTDANAHGSFTNMKKGNYFLYAVGFDSTINETVSGGIPVKIEGKNDEVEVDIPVTEGH